MHTNNTDQRAADSGPVRNVQAVASTLKAAAGYFVLVFGAGCLLGPIRVLWAVPRFGVRTAELVEAPIMLAVIILAAAWAVRRLAPTASVASRFAIGGIGLGLLLAAELTLVLWLRGISIAEYLANRDPVSGTVYYLLLGLFTIMPLMVARH